MTLDAPGRHCKNRLFEWAMTASLLGIGIVMVIWPDAFSRSKLQFMMDVVSPGILTIFCLTVGWCRGLALYLNGGWPIWGARVRMFAAMGGAAMWTQMGLSLILIQNTLNAPPSPSVPLYFSLVCAELYSTYRAAGDARFR